jgi:hypothetical protein
MISAMGKKVFFVHPPESLRDSFLDYIFKKEFEIYLLDDTEKLDRLLEQFKDSILFINIDKSRKSLEWIELIIGIQKRHKKLIIGVFSKIDSSSLQKALLMDIGIKGGFINIEQDNWKTIELITQVLEANEARGRRKSVRLDIDKNSGQTGLSVKIFTQKGYITQGLVTSFSSAGLLTKIVKGNIGTDDDVVKTIFKIDDKELQIKGTLLKRFENGDFFISFENISETDKDIVQTYRWIF